MSLHVISGEAAYAQVTTSLRVTNKDIHWPQCIRILPYTIPLVGKNITLYGMVG